MLHLVKSKGLSEISLEAIEMENFWKKAPTIKKKENRITLRDQFTSNETQQNHIRTVQDLRIRLLYHPSLGAQSMKLRPVSKTHRLKILESIQARFAITQLFALSGCSTFQKRVAYGLNSVF